MDKRSMSHGDVVEKNQPRERVLWQSHKWMAFQRHNEQNEAPSGPRFNRNRDQEKQILTHKHTNLSSEIPM